MSHKFQKMLELCRKNYSIRLIKDDPTGCWFFLELERVVFQYQAQADGWNKFKNYVAGIGASGNAEVNRFCILLLDKMETL
jgi:hypothetical protein